MRALAMHDVRFKYEGSDEWALDGVSMEVEKGEFVCILGPNGSGKSTLSLLTNGLIPHAIRGDLRGTVDVFGEDVTKRSVAEISKRVGMVFQEPESQLFCMSVEEEIAFGPENLGVPREEIAERVEWALDIIGMKGYNERSPFSLSGGQKQRVAIAAALSMHPDMIVLDEPAYALDPVGRVELYSVLMEIKKKRGVTVLLAERDAEEALFADRVVLMRDGCVVDSGRPCDSLRDTARLRSIGIAPPQIAEVAALMNSRLKRSDLAFLTIEEAERTIKGLLSSTGRSGRG